MIKHKPGKNDQPSHCYGSAREWLVARLNLLKAEKPVVGLGTWVLAKADGRSVDAVIQVETVDQAVAEALRASGSQAP